MSKVSQDHSATTVNGNSISKRLRPEARPVERSNLLENQREAFRRLLYTIQEAIQSLETATSDKKESAYQPQIDRLNRSTFLSGPRGSGKTSVLMSIMNLSYTDGIKTDLSHDSAQLSERYQNALQMLRDRVIWLDIIDMDPLPSPFALLPSIITRIQHTLEQLLRVEGRSMQPRTSTKIDSLFDQLDFLHSQATLAWESNIKKRRGVLDPEYYSREMKQTNVARLGLNTELGILLKNFADEIPHYSSKKDPIFVAVIDDFDLHPSACLQVLKMLRMLSIPRMFYLLLGDIDLLEAMSDLNTGSEIGGVATRVYSGFFGRRSEHFGRLSASISRNALRKMIPVEQRIHLGNSTVMEGMLFKPAYKAKEIGSTISLASMLANLPFVREPLLSKYINDKPKRDAESKRICGAMVFNLIDLILHPGFSILKMEGTSSEQEALEVFYDERLILKCAPVTFTAEKQAQVFNRLINPFEKSTDNSFGLHQLTHWGDGREFGYETLKLGATDEFSQIKRIKEWRFLPKSRENGFYSESSRELIEQFYWPIHIFELPPRKLSDLWFGLRRHVDRLHRELPELIKAKTSPEDAVKFFQRFYHDFLNEFSRICKLALEEESVYSMDQREAVREAMTPSSNGVWDWTHMPLQLVDVKDPPLVLSGSAWAKNRRLLIVSNSDQTVGDGEFFVKRNLYVEVQAFHVRGWELQVLPNKKSGRKSRSNSQASLNREVAPATASLLLFFHDLVQMKGAGEEIRSGLIPLDLNRLASEPNGLTNSKNKTKESINTLGDYWVSWAQTVFKAEREKKHPLVGRCLDCSHYLASTFFDERGIER